MSSLFVVNAAYTADGSTLFGKNANREPNEGQSIVRIPEMQQPDSMVQCTFSKIPQVKRTNEVILSKPYHSWGAEMGVNQHGVTIGNSPIYSTQVSNNTKKGLTGPDMVRLALERSNSAEIAFETICGLVSAFGQDVPDGYQTLNYMHNSFIIADARKAFLLETSGKQWVGKKIKAFQAISTSYTIGAEYDFYSKDVVAFAKENGWIKKGKDFSFKDTYGDKRKEKIAKAVKTKDFITSYLERKGHNISLETCFELLQSHHPSKNFNPSDAKIESVCKHNKDNVQTNGSLVAQIRKDGQHIAWLTGTSNPCLSIYKPFFMPGKNIFEGIFREPGKLINNSLWWQAEELFRRVSINYKQSLQTFSEEQQALQNEWIAQTNELIQAKTDPEALNDFSTTVLNTHIKKIMQWNYDLKKNPPVSKQFSPLYNRMIAKLNDEVTPKA